MKNKKTFYILPTLPFHFDGTFHKPSHFTDMLSDWEKGKYWQTIRVGKKIFGLKIEDKKPKLKITVFCDGKISAEEINFIKQELIFRFDLNKDLKEFNQLAKKDNRFYPVFKKWIGMRNSSAHNLYGLLVISIFLQNATVRRTVQMVEAMLKKYGTKIKFDNKEIYALWLPERLEKVDEQELRDLKIGYRTKFIKKLSHEFVEGKIDEQNLRKMNKKEAQEELIKLYGVGPETSRILLFEALHHNDVFDHVSPWQQKIYSQLFYHKPLVPAEKIRDDIKKRYGKYSMLAVHYIWEDIFWRRKNEHIEWLEKEIRL
jgi:3-methyladenine DNA glycosylase/8-oxoguanine DNA glycosylase